MSRGGQKRSRVKRSTITAVILSILLHAMLLFIPLPPSEKPSVRTLLIRMKLPPEIVEKKEEKKPRIEEEVEPPPPLAGGVEKKGPKKPRIEEVVEPPPPLAEGKGVKLGEAVEPPPLPAEGKPEEAIELPSLAGGEEVKAGEAVEHPAPEGAISIVTEPAGARYGIPGAIGGPAGSEFGVPGGTGTGIGGPGSKYGVPGGRGAGIGSEISLFKAMVRGKIERAKFYPGSARKEGYQGTVGVRFVLLPDGNVRDIKVVRPLPYETLNSAACEAIKRAAPFRPRPKELEGKEMAMEIDIIFRLE